MNWDTGTAARKQVGLDGVNRLAGPVSEVTRLLDSVRSACAAVATRARQVRIETVAIPAYAAALPVAKATTPTPDPDYFYLSDAETTLAYVLTLDSVNFGSGYFPHLRKLPGRSGARTIAAHLRRRFAAQGPFTAAELEALTAADCTRLFGQEPDGGPVDELMALFARALNDLGRFLLERYGGRFAGPVEVAAGSAERLVEILAQMPLYQDVAVYDGLTVPFYKRAQLAAADLALTLGGHGLGAFHDLERLTIFADNLVPHVLRCDGILHYSPALLARIEAEELIPAGAPEEVEIRACAVHAAELIVAELRRAGCAVSSMQLDYLLWNRGQQPGYKARPRHRTRTVFY